MDNTNELIYEKYILSSYNNLYELLYNDKLLEDIINEIGFNTLLDDIISMKDELDFLKHKVDNLRLAKQAIKYYHSMTDKECKENEEEVQNVVDYFMVKYKKEIEEYIRLNNINDGDVIDLLQFVKYLNGQQNKEN